jgi:late competence protein required for DNA uptake (superfamily II DNA/RNA helicase)
MPERFKNEERQIRCWEFQKSYVVCFSPVKSKPVGVYNMFTTCVYLLSCLISARLDEKKPLNMTHRERERKEKKKKWNTD